MADQIEISAKDRPVAPKKTAQSRWGRRLLTLLVATAAVGGFAVVVVYSYDKGRSVGGGGSVPIITAQEGPTKMRPKEPGGMTVPNRDKQVYGRLNVAERSTKVERLLPPPETVVSKPPAPVAPPIPTTAEPETAQIAKQLSAIEPAAGTANVPPPPAPRIQAMEKSATGSPQPAKKAQTSMEVANLTAPAEKAAMPASAVFRIQLASVRSRKAAENAWGKYKFDHAALFGKLEHKIVRVDLKGKGTFYRLQAGPFADASAARSLCSKAKKRKIGCIIVRP